jgi:antitoxin CptB
MDESTELARLRWRCRRGMRELDVLLERFIEADSAFTDPSQRAAFARLLELPDPLLAEWLILGLEPPQGLEDIVERIRSHDRTASA